MLDTVGCCILLSVNYLILIMVDIDECTQSLHDCSSSQTCENTDGGFTCRDIACTANQKYDVAAGACVR